MGAYLSEPITEKVSTDHGGERLKCGASSMQGWRTSQEDAHNCIIEYDKDASFFAVYDGHGGHEVAEYCAKNLPDFIKNSELYKNGKYEEALKEAFLNFDATLATPEVISILKEIAGTKDFDKKTNSDAEGDEDEEDGDILCNLVKEARMPLDEVMAQYQKGEGVNVARRLLGQDKLPGSPFLRARRSPKENASASGAGPSCSSSSSSTPFDDGEVSSSSNHNNEAQTSEVVCNGVVANGNGEISESEVGGSEDVKENNEVAGSDGSKEKKNKAKESEEKKNEVGRSGDGEVAILADNCVKEKNGKSEKEDEGTTPDSSGDTQNGEQHGVSSSSQNGDVVESSSNITSSSCTRAKRMRNVYKELLVDNTDSESEDDETFQGDTTVEGSDDDDDEAESGLDEDDDEELTEEGDEEEDEDGEEEEEDEEDNLAVMDLKEEPGSDSGCTAVVALVKGTEVFVANAGDSRCVVCRDGKAVDMSFDHKPEDEPERERIEKAGGKVTNDGRVNGGLNLSRAIGDHSYKQVTTLPATEQMITALPDIKRLKIDPVKDEFMVLACDGIWNFMSSQEVVDFVQKLINKDVKLSEICEQLFDFCLAPNTQGDGTGCDNMTCVIVQFKHKDSTLKPPVEESQKRPSSPIDNSESAKKIKLDTSSSD